MGAKRRVRQTSPLRGPVTRSVLDRYEVKQPISFAEWKNEVQRKSRKSRKEAA